MKVFLLLLGVLLASGFVSAQTNGETAAAAQNDTLRAESDLGNIRRLTDFSAVEVSGKLNVRFIRVGETETTQVAYGAETGNDELKLKIEVDKSGRLKISERIDSKRAVKTEVEVRYHTLEAVRIGSADAVFEGPVTAQLFDLGISSGGTLKAELDVQDLLMEATGNSRVELTGRATYLDATVSTAKVDASKLDTRSSEVEASHNAKVYINASDRLILKSSTGAEISYTGNPPIVRGKTSSIFGGTINGVEK